MRGEEKKAAPYLQESSITPPPPPTQSRPKPANNTHNYVRKGTNKDFLIRLNVRKQNQTRKWTCEDATSFLKEKQRQTRHELRLRIDQDMSVITIILAILSVIAMFFNFLLLECSWKKTTYSRNSCEGLKWLSLLITLMTILLIYAKYRLLGLNMNPAKELMYSKIHWEKLEGKYYIDNAWIDPSSYLKFSHIYWRFFFLEVVINSLHAPPTAHPMFAVFTFFRIYHVVGLLRFLPEVARVRHQQITAGQKAVQSFWGITKLCLRRYPLHSLFSFFLISLPTMSFVVFAIERYDASQIKDNNGYAEFFAKYHYGSKGWFDKGSGLNNYSKVLWVTMWMLFMRVPYEISVNGRLPALILGFISLTFFIMVFTGVQASLARSGEKMSMVDESVKRENYRVVKKYVQRYVFTKWRWYAQKKRLKNFRKNGAPPKDIKKLKHSCEELYESWNQARCNFKKVRLQYGQIVPIVGNGLFPKIGKILKTSNALFKNIESFRWKTFPILTKLDSMLRLVDLNSDNTSVFFKVHKRLEKVEKPAKGVPTKIINKVLKDIQQDLGNIQSDNQKSIDKTIKKINEVTNNFRKRMDKVKNQQEKRDNELKSFYNDLRNSSDLQAKLYMRIHDLMNELESIKGEQQEFITRQLDQLNQRIDGNLDQWESTLKLKKKSNIIQEMS